MTIETLFQVNEAIKRKLLFLFSLGIQKNLFPLPLSLLPPSVISLSLFLPNPWVNHLFARDLITTVDYVCNFFESSGIIFSALYITLHRNFYLKLTNEKQDKIQTAIYFLKKKFSFLNYLILFRFPPVIIPERCFLWIH